MNDHDLELLSSYLDGQLSLSDSARLESRLKSDGRLVSALDDLRAARTLLRQLPKRRAPRNFTLTRKMVGLKPPLPRTYPVFKFTTAFAAFLFFISVFATRTSQLAASAPAPASYGIGSGGGADVPATEESLMMESSLAATEAPATEAPALAPLPTEMASVPSDANPESETARVTEDPSAKNTPVPAPPLIANWQIALGMVALLGVAVMFLLRFLAARKWREK